MPAPSPDEPASATAVVDSLAPIDRKERDQTAAPALLATPTGTPNSTLLPTAPPPTATAAPPAAPHPPYDPTHARVTWSVGATGGGTTPVDVRRALTRISGAWNACYRDGLRTSGQRLEGSGVLRLATDEEGNVVQANLTGFTLSNVPACIASSARVHIEGVDTGSAWAEVRLVFRTEPSE